MISCNLLHWHVVINCLYIVMFHATLCLKVLKPGVFSNLFQNIPCVCKFYDDFFSFFPDLYPLTLSLVAFMSNQSHCYSLPFCIISFLVSELQQRGVGVREGIEWTSAAFHSYKVAFINFLIMFYLLLYAYSLSYQRLATTFVLSSLHFPRTVPL